MQMIEKESAIFELDEQDLKKVNDKMNYTTKQIVEAIEYWQSYLDESNDSQMVFERKMSRQELDDFYKKLQDDIVEFKYTKKDGTKRNAQGTLKKELMPSEKDLRKQYPDYDDMMKMFQARKDYMIYYWDLEKNAFRQFHVSRFDGFMDDDNVNEDENFSKDYSLQKILDMISNSGVKGKLLPDAYVNLHSNGTGMKSFLDGLVLGNKSLTFIVADNDNGYDSYRDEYDKAYDEQQDMQRVFKMVTDRKDRDCLYNPQKFNDLLEQYISWLRKNNVKLETVEVNFRPVAFVGGIYCRDYKFRIERGSHANLLIMDIQAYDSDDYDDNVNEDQQDLNGNFYCLDDILEALKGCPSKYEYSQIHIGPYGNHIGDIESIDYEFGTVYLNVKKAHTSMRRGPVEGCMKAVDVIKKFLEIKSQSKGRKVAVYAGEQLDPLSKKLGKKPQLSMIKDVEIAKIDGIWFRI